LFFGKAQFLIAEQLDPAQYEFEEIYHSDPVTGGGRYMLRHNDRHPETQFGLGLVVYVFLS
jgi:hypothetical protein